MYKGQAYTCKVNRLAEMTSYEFRVYASNDAGSGPYSEAYSFSTTKAPPPALKGIETPLCLKSAHKFTDKYIACLLVLC